MQPLAPGVGEAVLERFKVIGDVPVEVRAELDRRPITCRELLELQVGSLLVLTRPTGENIDVYAGDVLIGTGEILVIDTTLAVRVADLRELIGAAGQESAPPPPPPPMDEGEAL